MQIVEFARNERIVQPLRLEIDGTIVPAGGWDFEAEIVWREQIRGTLTVGNGIEVVQEIPSEGSSHIRVTIEPELLNIVPRNADAYLDVLTVTQADIPVAWERIALRRTR